MCKSPDVPLQAELLCWSFVVRVIDGKVELQVLKVGWFSIGWFMLAARHVGLRAHLDFCRMETFDHAHRIFVVPFDLKGHHWKVDGHIHIFSAGMLRPSTVKLLLPVKPYVLVRTLSASTHSKRIWAMILRLNLKNSRKIFDRYILQTSQAGQKVDVVDSTSFICYKSHMLLTISRIHAVTC